MQCDFLETLKALNIPFKIDSSRRANLVSVSNNVMKTLGICELNCNISNDNVPLSLAYTLFNVLVITYVPSTTQPFAVSLTYSNLHTLSLTRTYHHFNVSFSLDTSLHGVRMASALRRPAELSFEENCAENWRAFELDFDI